MASNKSEQLYKILTKKLSVCKSMEDIIKLVKPYTQPCHKKTFGAEDKSDKIANDLLTEAESCSDLHARLGLLTRCIAKAPARSAILNKAFILRCISLKKLGKYQECIKDTKNALILQKYHSLHKFKLLSLQGDCYAALNEIKDALRVYNQAKELLNTKFSVAESMKKDIDSKIAEIHEDNNKLQTVATVTSCDELPVPNISYGTDNESPCISIAVSIKYNTIFGCHLIANEDLNTGDVLLVEDPLAAVLDPNHTRKLCSHCFMQSNTLIPCNDCDKVMYCSLKCNEEAQTKYHNEECQLWKNYLQINPDADKSEFHIIRIIATLGIDNLIAENDCDENVRIAEFTRGKVISSDYSAVMSLIAHVFDRPIDEIYDGVQFAQEILQCYQLDNLPFSNKLAGKILKIFLCRDSNGFRLVDIIKDPLHEYKIKNTGAGLYVFSSLINHSCDPNIFRINYGTKLIHIASKPIPKDHQLMVSYGVNYHNTSKDERQRYLDKYYFKCKCDACEQDWPMLENLPHMPEFSIHESEIETKLDDLLACIELNDNLESNIKHYKRIMSILFHCGKYRNRKFLDIEGKFKNYHRLRYVVDDWSINS